MKRLIVILLLIAGVLESRAQSHQWANNITSSSKTYPEPRSLTIDSNNNIYQTIRFSDTLNLNGSLLIPKPNSSSWCITKLNKNGKYLWTTIIYANTKNQGAVSIANIHSINNNKIAICGSFTAPILKIGLTDSIINNKVTTGFVAILDSSGKFIEYQKIYENTSGSEILKFITDKSGNYYINFITSKDTGSIFYRGGALKIKADTSPWRYIIVKYNSNFTNINWYKELPTTTPINVSRSFEIHNMQIGKDNNLYLACDLCAAYKLVLAILLLLIIITNFKLAMPKGKV